MGNFIFIFSILVYEGKTKFPGFIIIRSIKYTFDTTFSTFNKNLEYYFCLVLDFIYISSILKGWSLFFPLIKKELCELRTLIQIHKSSQRVVGSDMCVYGSERGMAARRNPRTIVVEM